MMTDGIRENSAKSPPSDSVLSIVSTRAGANKINEAELEKISAPLYEYPGTLTGQFKESECPADKELKLKVGAQVMLLRNDKEKNWVNGTIGIVHSLSKNLVRVTIKGTTYPIDRETWDKTKYIYNKEKDTIEQQIIGSFSQFPLRLAYAITIHKSQGQTYDEVIIDYSEGRAFEKGQTYVALSRCKTLDKIYIPSPIEPKDIMVSQEVLEFMQGKRFFDDPSTPPFTSSLPSSASISKEKDGVATSGKPPLNPPYAESSDAFTHISDSKPALDYHISNRRIYPVKCAFCGSKDFSFDKDSGMLSCHYCDTSYLVSHQFS